MEQRLVEEYRGNTLENIHFGHICGIDATGAVTYRVGDPDWVTYMRSAAKPVQAVPAFLHGADVKFGFNDKERTIMMASHRAEQCHVDALESMLSKLNIDEECLVCHSTYPLSGRARDELIVHGGAPRKIYHNCSGKHLGVLALCKVMGYSLDNYYDLAHPAQQEILDMVELLSGCPKDEIRLGTDGCGFPVFGLSLRHMANLFLKFACPDLIERADVREAVTKIARLMNENSEMVSADWFICSNMLMDSNIVAKGGAKGVYCFGLREERMAFALKVLDGSEDEWPLIIASILEQIGYKNKETIERMYKLTPREIRNDNKLVVGENRAVFQLQSV